MNKKMLEVQVKTSFPFFSIMFLIFMTLKLTGHITWSWWWVTAPLWGPFAAFIGVFIIFLIIGFIIAILS